MVPANKNPGSVGIYISGARNPHIEGGSIHADTPIVIEGEGVSTATVRNVTTSAELALGGDGLTATNKGTFDPKASAAIATHVGGKNPFDDPKSLIDQARDHIQDLETRLKAFFDGHPYALVVEADANVGQEVHKVRMTEDVPDKAARVAKDAFTNLRDVLDHAVYASSVVLYAGKKFGKTGFPFGENAASVHDKLNTELLGVSPAVRSFLEELRPHNGGNILLWGLNSVRNVETHRIIVPLLSASLGNSLRINGDIIGHAQIGQNRWDATKKEVEFLRVGAGSKVQYKLDLAFGVLLGDVQGLGGKSAIDALYVITSEIEGIVLALEAETGRLLRAES